MRTKESFFEQNGGTYTQVGDVLLPDLSIGEVEQSLIGKYGRMRKTRQANLRASRFRPRRTCLPPIAFWNCVRNSSPSSESGSQAGRPGRVEDP